MVDKLRNMIMSDSQELGRFMTLDETASVMDVSKRTIHNYIKEGSLDKIRVGGRTFILVSSMIAKGLRDKVIRQDDIRDKELKRETLFHLRTKVEQNADEKE